MKIIQEQLINLIISTTPEDVPLSIIDISHPRYTYAVTKILGESGFLNYANTYGFECTIIRYHNVIGLEWDLSMLFHI